MGAHLGAPVTMRIVLVSLLVLTAFAALATPADADHVPCFKHNHNGMRFFCVESAQAWVEEGDPCRSPVHENAYWCQM